MAAATVDNDPSPSELAYIAAESGKMKGKLDVLKEDDKLEIVKAAIRLALADEKFEDAEYGAIRTKASQYDIPESTVDQIIREECQSAKVGLPTALREG